MEQMEESDVWKEIVRRWNKKKQEHSDAIRKLASRKDDLKSCLKELQTKMSTSAFTIASVKQQQHISNKYQNTQLHQILKESTEPATRATKKSPSTEKFTESFRKILAYTIDQVETFFRDDLKSDDVLLLLDRIDYLEMQLSQLIKVFEDDRSSTFSI